MEYINTKCYTWNHQKARINAYSFIHLKLTNTFHALVNWTLALKVMAIFSFTLDFVKSNYEK